MSMPPPRYEEWLHHCFGRFSAATQHDDLWQLTREDDSEFSAVPSEIVDLYTATMLRSGQDLVHYSNVTLGYGLSFMFESHFASTIYQYCDRVGAEQLLCIEVLFRDCIEPRKLPIYRGVDLSSYCRLGWVVFDFWDNSALNTFDDRQRQQAIISVMEQCLELGSDGCIQSALHGLGHQHWSDSERVEAIIDRFLSDRLDVNAELAVYAQRCRTGQIL